MGYRFNDDVYGPCRCGSGKKYKFCCLPKDRERRRLLTSEDEIPPRWRNESILVMDLEEGERAHRAGIELLESGNGREAIPLFEHSIRQAPLIPQPHNNLALAHFLEGEVEEAIEVAGRVHRSIDPGNVYTLGLLIHFHLMTGRRAEAERLADLLSLKPPPDGCALYKKCEALARLKMHERILESARPDRVERAARAGIAFFAGAAAANLARYDEALASFQAAFADPIHGDRAKRYHRLIERRLGPQTLEDDWPYLDAREWAPPGLIDRLLKSVEMDRFPGLVEAVIAVMNDRPAETESAVGILSRIGTPRAVEVLRKVAFGTFGTEKGRMGALLELRRIGQVDSQEKVKIWRDDDWTEMRAHSLEITEEETSRFPPRLASEMEGLILANRSRDWARAERLGRRLLEEAPDCPMVYQNLAVALHNLKREDEAEALLRRAIEIDPSYLFAPASLAASLLRKDRVVEALEVLRGVVMPARVHPQAYQAFMEANLQAALLQHDFEAASSALEVLKEVAPESDLARRLSPVLPFQLVKLVSRLRKRARGRRRDSKRRLLGPESPLEVCLGGYTRYQLNGMGTVLELSGIQKLKKDEFLRVVADCLRKPETIRKALRTLPRPALEAVSALLNGGGSMSYVEFTRRHGPDSADTPYWGWKLPRTPLGLLKVRGLAVEGTVGGRECVLIPPEILGAVKQELASVRAREPADQRE